jgi:hypothetical protein
MRIPVPFMPCHSSICKLWHPWCLNLPRPMHSPPPVPRPPPPTGAGSLAHSVVEECVHRPQAFTSVLAMLREADPILSPAALALLRALALAECVSRGTLPFPALGLRPCSSYPTLNPLP